MNPRPKAIRHPNINRRLRFLGLDRLSPERREHATCVMLQIDGLSYTLFKRALGEGKLPFLSKLIRQRKARYGPWSSMLPTSTSAFQSGLFYNDNEDIPGFFWYDKRRRCTVRMNGTEDTARLEHAVVDKVRPFPGLLAEGSSYSALFTGGADFSFLTFSKLFQPKLNFETKRISLILFALSQVQLFARIVYYSTIEIFLALYDMVIGMFTEKNAYLEFKFLFPRIASVVFCREIATLAAILDILRGVGPIYLNHFAYDEHAHLRGPDSKFALWTLKGLDASIKRVWRAADYARRHKIRQYDVYVWSDHGQTRCKPFQEVFEQDPDRHFDLLFRSVYGSTVEQRLQAEKLNAAERIRRGRVLRVQRSRRMPVYERQTERLSHIEGVYPPGMRRLFRLATLQAQRAGERQQRQVADPERRIQVVSTGPVAHLYLLDIDEPVSYEQWREQYGLYLDMIAAHQGVGFALARTRDGGAMVGCDGAWFALDDAAALARHAPPLVLGILSQRREDFRRWATMPSAGDMILFGVGAEPDTLSFSYERGGHSGPSPEEVTPFMVVPAPCTEYFPELSARSRLPKLRLESLHARLRNLYTDHHIEEPDIQADAIGAAETPKNGASVASIPLDGALTPKPKAIR